MSVINDLDLRLIFDQNRVHIKLSENKSFLFFWKSNIFGDTNTDYNLLVSKYVKR